MNPEIKTISIAGGDVRMIEQDNTVYLAGVDFKQIMNTCSTYFATQCNRLKISPAFKVGVTGYTLISDVIEVFEHLNTSKLTVMQNRESISKILNDLKAIQENLNTVPAVIPTELELTKEMIDYAIDLKISPRDCKRYWDSSIKKQIERHDHPPFSYFKIAIEQIALNRAKLDVARLITDQMPSLLPEVEELKATMEPKSVEMPKQDFSFNFVGVESELNGIKQMLINSRDLHEQLQVKSNYTTWIKRKIESSGFKLNEHYKVNSKKGINPLGGRPTEEYLISIRMAEHIAQSENDVARLIVDQTPMLPEVSELKETIEASQEPKAVEMPKTDFDFSFAFKTAVVDGIEQPVISSIELHEKLEVKTDHRKWIERRLSESDAEKNKGYLSWTNLSVANSNNSKARPQEVKEYLLTIPTAKDIAMLERSAIGTKVRKYFRDCESTLEKVVNSQSQVGDQSTSQSIPTHYIPTQDEINRITEMNRQVGNTLTHTRGLKKIHDACGSTETEAFVGINNYYKNKFGVDFLADIGVNVKRAESIVKHSRIKQLDSQNNPTQNGLF